MKKHAIEGKLTGFILTSSTVASADVVPVDQTTMLPAAAGGEDVMDREWVMLDGRNSPSFAKRFPVNFRPGDVVHVLQMDHGITAKPNRPALVVNETTGQEHVERLSPPPLGILGLVFGQVGIWLLALGAISLAAIEAPAFGLGPGAVTILTVLAGVVGLIWGIRLITEASYLVRSRRRIADETAAVAEARRIIAEERSDA